MSRSNQGDFFRVALIGRSSNSADDFSDGCRIHIVNIIIITIIISIVAGQSIASGRKNVPSG